MVLFALLVCLAGASSRTVLVTGATGGTGKHIYAGFKKLPGFQTRALVSSTEKARARLGCDKCDVSEGIFVGDVTKPDTLRAAMAGGVTDLAIAVGLDGNETLALMQAVEWHGVQNQVKQLAEGALNAHISLEALHVSLISSMGTTNPKPPPYEGSLLPHSLTSASPQPHQPIWPRICCSSVGWPSSAASDHLKSPLCALLTTYLAQGDRSVLEATSRGFSAVVRSFVYNR